MAKHLSTIAFSTALTLGLIVGMQTPPARVQAAALPSAISASQPLYSSLEGNEIRSLRASTSAEKVRLVIETELQAHYQINFKNRGQGLQVELLDTRQGPTRSLALSPQSSISASQVEWPNFNRFSWQLAFKRAIDPSQVKVFHLQEPQRLVIDLPWEKPKETEYALSPGLTWKRSFIPDPTYGQVMWNELLFDRRDPHLSLDIAFPPSGPHSVAKLSEIVSHSGAIAGINGGFFNLRGGEMLGLAYKDGQVLSPHISRRPARSALAITLNNTPFIERLKAIKGQIVTLSGQTSPPLRFALGGGPTLLKDGGLHLTTEAEELGPKGNDITRACGRSVVAFNENQILLGTLSGMRDSHSQGWKLPKMANFLAKLGMDEALNLDGGGSVGMAIGSHIVGNGPQAGSYQRPVANALVIRDNRGATYPSQIKLHLPDALPADGHTSAPASLEVRNAQGQPVADGWQIALQARNLVCPAQVTTKDGQATFTVRSMHAPGMANLQAYSLFSQASANLPLAGGRPQRLLARLTSYLPLDTPLNLPQEEESPSSLGPLPQLVPIPGLTPQILAPPSAQPSFSDPQRLYQVALELLVEDEWLNPAPQQPVVVRNLQGEILASGQTDNEGQASWSLRLPASQSELLLESGALPPLRLELAPHPRFK